MNILIVSGFLGAGKTTFIKELAKKTGRQFAVMENEYGETGIDGSLLEKDRMKVWELTEGCICCSLKSDFASSVLTIANAADPEFLIVEPTGVGLLSSVISNLEKIEYERIRLLEPLTIVDVHCADAYIETFGEFYVDQIRNATRLVLSKTQTADPVQAERIGRRLASINPQAEILAKPYEAVPVLWWEAVLHSFKNKKGGILPDIFADSPDLDSTAIENISIKTIDELMYKLMLIIQNRFGRVYRVKGFVPVNGQWARFDVVDTRYTIETCEAMDTAKAVVIGRDLDTGRLRRLFTETTADLQNG